MTITGEDTLQHLLPSFYKQYKLDGDGGINDSKVKIEINKRFYFYIPNFPSRKKAVLKHDIHHIITGYPSHFIGETEISAWEVASGCKSYWIAWALNFHGMVAGFWFNLRGIYHAFVRGRRSKNLYSNLVTDREVLEMHVNDLQNLLTIPPNDAQLKSTSGDLILFIFWILIAGIYSVASIILLPLIIVYNIILFAKIPHTSTLL